MNLFVFHTVSRNHWTDHVLGWWNHKDDPNVLFLKFEDLQKVCWTDVCVLSCTGLLIYSSEKRFQARFLVPFQSLREKPLKRGCFFAIFLALERIGRSADNLADNWGEFQNKLTPPHERSC